MSLGAGRGFSIANLCTGIQHIIIKLFNTLNFQFEMKQKIGFPRVERCCPDQTNLLTKLVQILYVCLMNLCERIYVTERKLLTEVTGKPWLLCHGTVVS